jgi:hypothetical protein
MRYFVSDDNEEFAAEPHQYSRRQLNLGREPVRRAARRFLFTL